MPSGQFKIQTFLEWTSAHFLRWWARGPSALRRTLATFRPAIATRNSLRPVSGIHEAASFPPNMLLYGYNFTFASYRLLYLDSEKWDSGNDGELVFPAQPAGF